MKLEVMAALNQRIGTRFTIGPMDLDETSDYIKGHLGFAGRSDTLFSEETIAVIHQASRLSTEGKQYCCYRAHGYSGGEGAVVDHAVTEFSE